MSASLRLQTPEFATYLFNLISSLSDLILTTCCFGLSVLLNFGAGLFSEEKDFPDSFFLKSGFLLSETLPLLLAPDDFLMLLFFCKDSQFK